MATYSGTPRTWAAGETLTAALLNSDVRDPLAALAGAWNSYTPTAAGANLTVGDGTTAGKYVRVGKLIIFNASFTLGSTSAVAASCVPTLSLPVTNLATTGPMSANFVDASSTTYLAIALPSTTVASVYAIGTAGAIQTLSSTSPFTWATGDVIRVAGIYEAA